MSEGINLGMEGVKHPYGVSPVERARSEYMESKYRYVFGHDDMNNSPVNISREDLTDILTKYGEFIASPDLDEDDLRESIESDLLFEEMEVSPEQLTYLLIGIEFKLYDQGKLSEKLNDF